MRIVRGRGRYAICALLALAVLGLLLVERTAGASPRSATLWSAPRSANAFSFFDQAKRLAAPIFGPNVRANQDTTIYAQHEPSLAVSRVHTNTVIVASKDYRQANVKRVWIDGSTDGGATWPVQVHMPNLPATDSESDPVVIARDDGRIYVACLTTGNNGIWITWTDDDGQTWHPSVPVIQNQGGLQDKEWFAIDNNPASPYYHRMYMMYVPDPGFGSGVVEHHSTDGGLTWSGQQPIGGADTEYTYPVIASDGTVYNFMMENWGFGQTGTVQMTKSTNGGATWSTPLDVATAFQPVSPIRQPDQFRFFAIISAAIDPINGNLYVAWTDNRNFSTNGTDVVYVRSTNGGTSWSAVTRLSHDPTGVVRDHITPMLKVGADGKLHAFWLDRRLDPNNRLFDSWYSSSTDGGNTWEPDTRVSTLSQDLNVGLPCCSGNYPAGDYWGLDTALDTVYVAWNDTRSGDQDILVSKGLMHFVGPSTATPAVTGTPPTATTISTATGTSVPTNTPTASATPVCTISVSSNDVPKTISLGGTVTSTLTISQGASIADIDLVLGINSEATSGGFRVSLTSPAGTTRVLVDAACGPYDNIYLDDEASEPIMGQCPPLTRQRFRPYTPLTAFDGENPAGTWTLTATDVTSEAEGELFAWGLLITGSGLCPTGTPTSSTFTTTPTAQASATATRTATASVTPQPACDVTWRVVQAPDVGILRGVAAITPDDVWGVGDGIMHWNGNAWLSVPVPSLNGRNVSFADVAASGPGDVWAVGTYFHQTYGQITLAMHWDGAQWSTVATPRGPGITNYLTGVAVLSPTDAWSVGSGSTASTLGLPIVLHWDGTSWNQVDLPSGGLSDISALSSDDVWVVGSSTHSPATYPRSLIAHWDGANWDYVESPEIGPLNAVEAIATNDVWAAGNGAFLHWDGAAWTEAGSVTGAASISAASANDVWAGGNFMQHWDGVAGEWVADLSAPDAIINGVAALAGDNVWAVGSDDNGDTRILRYTNQRFADVPPTNTFYPYVQCLTCRGIISGYPCGGTGEPCDADDLPYFRPNTSITRGQIAKIVSNSAGFNEEPGEQIFEDTPPGSPFYVWINRLAMRGHMAGYPCGTMTSEPCVSPGNRPYFRPNANATRGQLAKIVANAAGFQGNPGPQIYEDVPASNTFFAFINRLSNRQVMGGYPCGVLPGGPCMPPGNRPYFRPNNNVTRGQASKIVANTFFQGCETRIRP
jgi:subtilisin-like proprotein convertase family protein